MFEAAIFIILIFGVALLSLGLIFVSRKLSKNGNRFATTLFFPAFITIIFTLIKYSEISENAGGGDFKGFAIFALPLLGIIVFGVSFLVTIFLQALWIGICFVARNRNNKERRIAVILTLFIVIVSPVTVVYLGYSEKQKEGRGHQKEIDDQRFWDNVFITMNASLPLDKYKEHLSEESKEFMSEPLDIYITHPRNKNREFIANKLSYDYDAKISSEMLTVLYRLGFGVQSHPNIDPKLAEELYKNSLNGKPNYVAMQSLARNAGTPNAILEKISDHESLYVLQELAMNTSASVAILEKLIFKANEKIAEENKKQNPEAYNINMQTEILKRAQETLAKHPSTPASRLKELSTINFDTCKAVAGNPFAPTELLEELAKDSNEWVHFLALVTLGSSPNTKKERLVELSQDKDDRVREAVAKNKAAPLDLLTTLLHDKEMKVSHATFKNLANQNPVPEEILLSYLDRLDRRLTTEDYSPEWLRKELIRINKGSSGKIYFIIKRLPLNKYSEDELKEVLELIPQYKISFSKDREMPIRLLKILSMDANKEISDSAKATLKSLLKSFEAEL